MTLYYAKVADSGKISLDPVERQIDFQDSPLTSSLRVLLQGPNGNELSSGLVSMIPAGTDLLSAWIRGNTAFLNFSESFQFNPLGPDGLRAQIAQVVYAATEFPTVKDVQILIDGKTIDYLGGDNVYVGKPISRKTLP